MLAAFYILSTFLFLGAPDPQKALLPAEANDIINKDIQDALASVPSINRYNIVKANEIIETEAGRLIDKYSVELVEPITALMYKKGYIRSSDRRLCGAVLSKLSESKKARRAFIELIKGNPSFTECVAAYELSRLDKNKARDIATEALNTTDDRYVKISLIGLLGVVGDRNTVAILQVIEQADSEHEEIKEAAHQARTYLEYRMNLPSKEARDSWNKQAVEYYSALRNTSIIGSCSAMTQYYTAAEILANQNRRFSLDFLRYHLDRKETLAVAIMGRQRDKEFLCELERRMKNSRRGSGYFRLYGTAYMKIVEDVYIRDYLDSIYDERIRISYNRERHEQIEAEAERLVEKYGMELVEPMTFLASDGRSGTKRLGLAVLVKLGDSEPVKKSFQRLISGESPQHRLAVFALARLDKDSARDVALSALPMSSKTVKILIIQLLGVIGDANTVAILRDIEQTGDENEQLKETAHQARTYLEYRMNLPAKEARESWAEQALAFFLGPGETNPYGYRTQYMYFCQAAEYLAGQNHQFSINFLRYHLDRKEPLAAAIIGCQREVDALEDLKKCLSEEYGNEEQEFKLSCRWAYRRIQKSNELNSVPRSTASKDLSELTRIAGLKGQAYIAARNQFIQSRKEPVDIDKAIEKGWPEGPLALIINARIDEPEWFKGWDNSKVGSSRRGSLFWSANPAPHSGPNKKKLRSYLSIFIMENIWKFYESSFYGKENKPRYLPYGRDSISKGLWPRIILDEMVHDYVRGVKNISKPAKLWRKVALETTDHRLSIIACRTLTDDPNQLNGEFLESKLRQATHPQVKMAIMSGLKHNKPKYTSRIVLNTYNNWIKDNFSFWGIRTFYVASDAFQIMATQPANSDSRKLLRQIIIEPNEPDEIRKLAMAAMSLIKKPEPQDIACLKEVFDCSENIELRRTAAGTLIHYPYSLTHKIIQGILETETDYYILTRGIGVIRGFKKEERPGLLKKLLLREDISNDVRVYADHVLE